ncbi:hypothetical protein C2D63_15575 [Klebsiella pneumoniae]|nr:hypothetical protein C2D63_15575 [Klebsiella pneumoniae]
MVLSSEKAAATAGAFSIHNTQEHLRLQSARVDWVMSPSPGDALVSCVKRAVPETKGNWHRQNFTQLSLQVLRVTTLAT